jgi:hypothetical protein
MGADWAGTTGGWVDRDELEYIDKLQDGKVYDGMGWDESNTGQYEF